MSYNLSFGKHEGRSFEWIFFKAPRYAYWIYDKGVYRQEHNMEEDEGRYFNELYRRAEHLAGNCTVCKHRPVQRMGLTNHHGTGALGAVGYYCDECEYQGGSPTGYHQPSFFMTAYDLSRCEKLRITAEIQRHYIGTGNLTQKKMEAFFHNEANFVNGRANAFTTPTYNGGLLVMEPP